MISSTQSGDSPNQPISADGLRKQILILDLIIRRNKNQHRSQQFFKHAQLLRGALKRLTTVHDQLERLSVSQKIKSAEEVRRKFEQEASLRGQREVIEEHIRDVLVPKCYVSFSTVVADLPFANLGIVLMGLLAEIAVGKNGVGAPLPMTDTEELRTESIRGRSGGTRSQAEPSEIDRLSVIGLSTRVTGEDHGEVVERRYEHSNLIEQDQPGSMLVETSAGIERKPDNDMDIMVENDYKNHIKIGDPIARPIHFGVREGKLEKPVVKEKQTKKKKSTLDDLFSNLI